MVQPVFCIVDTGSCLRHCSLTAVVTNLTSAPPPKLKTSWSFISKGLKSPAPFQCDSAIMVLEAPRRLVPNGLLREMLIGG